jgi:hypothetical protein
MDPELQPLTAGVALIYLICVSTAMLQTDAAWPTRLTLALLWPIGPLAFALTVTLLLAASLIAFPIGGLLVAAAALVGWLMA